MYLLAINILKLLDGCDKFPCDKYHALPQSLDAIHPVASHPASIHDIMVDPRSGQLKVTLGVGYLRGKAFYLAPSVEGGKIGWRCLHGDVPLRLMPEQCKYDAADPFRL